MKESRASIADEKIWLDVKERWKQGETVFQIVRSYANKKDGSVFQIDRILSRRNRAIRPYETPSWISICEAIGMRYIKKGCTTKAILRLMNDSVGRNSKYRFNEKDVEYLRKMTGLEGQPVIYRAYRPEEKPSFCGILHQELKRVKKEADADSLFLDKRFLSKVVDDLDSCYDAPIIEDVKERVETKKRNKVERATRPKRKYHKRIGIG